MTFRERESGFWWKRAVEPERLINSVSNGIIKRGVQPEETRAANSTHEEPRAQ